MIGSLKDWFQALSLREKILIAILAVLIILFIGVYGIIRPIFAAIDNAEAEYVLAIERQARIESKVAALTAPLDGLGKPIVGSIDVFVSQSAGETGFAVGKMDVQSDGSINLTIESAKSTALFGWLSKLEARGITPTDIAVTPIGNGAVSGSLTLRKATE